MIRRSSRPAALSPPVSRLPPGAGNEADQLEGEYLEPTKKGYLDAVGQADGHARAISADGDGGELTLPVCLTHVSRWSFRAET